MLFQNDVQTQFADLSVGDRVVSLTQAGAQVVLGTDYFEITDQTVRLTQGGVDFIRHQGALPTLAISGSSGETTYLVTRAFGMTDDVNVKPGVDPAVKDFTTLQVRNIDGTAANHSIAMLRTDLSGVSEFSADLVAASLNLWTTSGNKLATDGGLDLYVLADPSWSEATITGSPYDGILPYDGSTLHGAFAHALGGPSAFVAGAGFDIANSAVHFDLTDAGIGNGAISFALLSDGVSTNNYWLHSTESDAAAFRPTVTVTYATTTPVRAVDDTLTVKEGGSNIGTPMKLLANDIALDPGAAREITSINGIAWDDLPLSDHEIFSEAGAFRAVTGTYGTLFVQQDGHAFYEHDGGNLSADVQDGFGYTFSDGTLTSTVGDLIVDVTAANQAPELTLSALNVLASVAGAAAGDVVARFTAADPDGDALAIGWTNDVTPVDGAGAPLYAIDVADRAVTLTEAGAAHVNAGGSLPKISLTLIDDAEETGSATATATPHAAHGNVWFVDQTNGNDANTGDSLGSAFASFDAAHAVVAAGDTIFLVGSYQRDDYDPNFTIETAADIMDPYVWNTKGTVRVRDVHGTEDAPITYRGWDDNAKIIGQGNAGFQIDDSSHLRIENLEVVGLVDELQGQAEKLQFVYRIDNTASDYDPSVYRYLTDKDGVTHDLLIGSDGEHDYFYRVPPESTAAFVQDHFSEPGSLPILPKSDERPALANSAGILSRDSTYIDIVENHVHHVAGTGIRVQRGEYVNVVGNEVHDTTRASSLGTQAIVVQDVEHTIDVLPDQSNLYKIVFADNEVFNNFNGMFSWVGSKDFITPHLDEGNGVSPQWLTHESWLAEGATGRVLIADNVTYLNGMAGINNHGGDRVVVVNNTSWMNASYGHLLNVSDTGSNGGIVSPADTKNGVEYGDYIWFYNNLSVANGLHNGGNHFAIRVNPNSDRVNDAGGRISGPITFDGAANAGFDLADGPIRFEEEELAYEGFIFDTQGISAGSLFVDPTTFDFRAAPDSALASAASDLIDGLYLPSFIVDDIYDRGAGFDQIGASAAVDLPGTTWLLDPAAEPITVTLANTVSSLPENIDTSARVKVADIVLGGETSGTPDLVLGGDDAALFEIDGAVLYLRAGAEVDYETQTSFAVTISASPESSATLSLAVTDVNEAPTVTLANTVSSLPENIDTSARVKVADIVVRDDALGSSDLALGGDDLAVFEIDGSALYLRAGVVLDFETQNQFAVSVTLDDPTVGTSPDASATFRFALTDVEEDDRIDDTPQDNEPDEDVDIGTTLVGGAEGDTLDGGIGNDTVNGGQGDDVVNGEAGRDVITGGEGADTISGGEGRDVLSGGADDDAMYGGRGRDVIMGGAGNDFANGGAGKDKISGGDGDDVINGGPGRDILGGGLGSDTISGGVGRDILRGGGDDDEMHGDAGDDRLFGYGGNDVLAGGGRDDVIYGGSGHDTIVGGTGNDTMIGGSDTDMFVFDILRKGELDTIADFQDGIDLIAIHILNTKSGKPNIQSDERGDSGFFDAVTIADTAQGAVLTVKGHQIVLEGMTAANLTSDDFVFV